MTTKKKNRALGLLESFITKEVENYLNEEVINDISKYFQEFYDRDYKSHYYLLDTTNRDEFVELLKDIYKQKNTTELSEILSYTHTGKNMPRTIKNYVENEDVWKNLKQDLTKSDNNKQGISSEIQFANKKIKIPKIIPVLESLKFLGVSSEWLIKNIKKKSGLTQIETVIIFCFFIYKKYIMGGQGMSIKFDY